MELLSVPLAEIKLAWHTAPHHYQWLQKYECGLITGRKFKETIVIQNIPFHM